MREKQTAETLTPGSVLKLDWLREMEQVNSKKQ